MKVESTPLSFTWDILMVISSFTAAIGLPLLLLYASPGGIPVQGFFLLASVLNSGDLIRNILDDRAQDQLQLGKHWIKKKGHTLDRVVDILAALPVGVVLYPLAQSTSLPLMSLLCLLPLVKLPRINGILFRRLGMGMNPAIFRLGTLVVWVLLATHLIACAWVGLADTRLPEDPFYEYIRALYWSVTTVTTIGYGDITPKTSLQTIFTMFIELFGAAVFSMAVANLATLVASIDGAKTRHKEKLDKVGTYLSYKKIPRSLQTQVFDYFDYLWESRRGFDEQSVLDELPQPLRVNISMQINRDMIAKVPFFTNAKPDLLREIVMNLQPVVYPPGEDIMRAGELANDMYFISSGSVDVLVGPKSERVATLGQGAFFGEIALLFSTVRTATVRAIDYCDLYRLHRETFERIMRGYPEFHEYIKQMAEERRAQL